MLDLAEARATLHRLGDAPSIPVSPSWFRQALAELEDARRIAAAVIPAPRANRTAPTA